MALQEELTLEVFATNVEIPVILQGGSLTSMFLPFSPEIKVQGVGFY